MYTRPCSRTTALYLSLVTMFTFGPGDFSPNRDFMRLGHDASDGDLRLISNFHHSGADLIFQRIPDPESAPEARSGR
jgi:hypothetical protein